MRRAKACDPVSIYGGIVGVNRTVDLEVVKELSGILLEILFAPAYEPDALEEIRRTKKKCRVFQLPCAPCRLSGAHAPRCGACWGGLLAPGGRSHRSRPGRAQGGLAARAHRGGDARPCASPGGWPSTPSPTPSCSPPREQVVGVGAGQMNRVDSARIAVMRAREVGLETKGSVCASDAFFPFRDGLDVVAKAGATAVIHPGGSVRDEEVVAAADEHGMAMVVCGHPPLQALALRLERVFTLRELTRLLRLSPKRALAAPAPGPAARRPERPTASASWSSAARAPRPAGERRERAPGARGARRAPGGSPPTCGRRSPSCACPCDGQRVVVEQDRLRFDPRTGQALLDFARGRPRARDARVPADRDGAAR